MTSLHYQLEVKCEQGSDDIDAILDHEATLSIIGMSPNKYVKLDAEAAKALLIKKCSRMFAGELYIGSSDLRNRTAPAKPHIRVSTLWHTSRIDK
ncbi:unnamed protein product [Linum trigynum]|uniref:Uncharacterized protein n=1 Tax=Linum trigynum TaxID=586398 RepID=A0AAV2FWW5_9ROSI